MADPKIPINYLVLPVDGMTCASCAARVKKSLSDLDWIDSVDVNLAAEQAAIGFSAAIADAQELKKTIQDAGYNIRTRTSTIIIPGFNDPTKISDLQEALLHIDGLEDCAFNTANETLTVAYIPGLINVRQFEKIVSRETGVKVVWRESSNNGIDAQHEQETAERIKRQFRNAVASIISAAAVFILTMPHFFSFVTIIPPFLREPLAFALTTWVLFYAGKEIFNRFLSKLRPGKSDMNTLVALGAGTAWVYSSVIMFAGLFAKMDFSTFPLFFDSAAFIVGFILLGRSLEARARRQTGQALNALAKLQPEKARILQNGETMLVEINALKENDHVLIKNGERAPADGILLSAQAEIDEAMLSGESLPQTKEKGQLVLTGTINSGSEIQLQVLKTGVDTALGQILKWVRQAQNSQPPVQRLVDKIAAVFVPAVIMTALITLSVWLFTGAAVSISLMHFINVIVIACPCALGLATPTAIVVAMGRAANTGVLIKDASVLERLLNVQTVLFDKTGTLTTGKLSFAQIKVYKENENTILQIAAMLEKHSTHPIAKAIIAESEKRTLQIAEVDKAEMLTGFGIRAVLDGKNIGAGNKKLMQAMQVALPDGLEKDEQYMSAQGMSLIFVAREKELLGLIGLADTIRSEAKEIVEQLTEQGITSAMVTGDAEKTAQHIAEQLDIKQVYSEQPPQVKANIVKGIQKDSQAVAMIGDGVNDAVALSQADIGIALAEGTDVAVDAADLVLLRPELKLLLKVQKLAHKTERIIRQNLVWAFGYNLLMLPSAAGLLYLLWGIAFNPAFAALAMAISSVSVVSNSLRLKRIKLK